MSKKVKRYNDGGDIVVTGRKSPMNSFDLARMSGSSGLLGGGMGGVSSGGGGGGGGSVNTSQRFTPTPAPSRSNLSVGKTYTAAGPVYGPRYSGENFSVGAGLGRGALGKAGAPVAGITGNFRLKKGGKVKKMAKGGSTASKRADGCATKGKTKGRII